ncbi:glycine hydroxymethyltransferase [Pancytospora philotis]|nr:glycine hydroxymethyltransferase [Pancytospora philotis]
MLHDYLQDCDPEIDELIRREEKRQRETLELIASENFTSVSVMQAGSSVLTNKYSEGQVGMRYYGGNENIDKIETICKQRALALFGLDPAVWDVNVQPLSGSAANIAVYTGLCGPGGKIMGLDLPSGGHLTHGFQTPRRKISASSMFFRSEAYKCGADGLVDYERLAEQCSDFQPDVLICGGSAYVREFDYARLRDIAGDAFLMMDMAHVSGLIAAGAMASPFEHCDVVTTTAHKVLRGPRAAMIFYRKEKIRNGRPFNVKSAIDSAVFPGLQGGPHNQKIAALAVALRQAASEEYKQYARQVLANAQAMDTELRRLGYRTLTGGTDCHMLLLCLDGIGGAEVERACEYANICVNRNCIVSDTSPLNPSAVRLGTPALTTRGFAEADFVRTVGYIDRAIQIARKARVLCLDEHGAVCMPRFCEALLADQALQKLKAEVMEFVSGFSIPCFNYRY